MEYLSQKSRAHFDKVASLLQQAGIPYAIDGALVRGFDYYTDTLWEVVAGGLGAQNAIGGGGRYDNLVEMLGGRPTPGVGFGSGLERLLIALDAQNVTIFKDAKPLVWLVAHGDAARDANTTLLRELRAAGIAADSDPSGRSVKAQFKMAEREGAAFALVRGEDELASNTVALKNLQTREETRVARAEIIAKLKP
jgi:histidyl-tRNA synthetase